jgi:peptide deformylase
MTLLPIVTVGHPVLREPARDVTIDELASAEIQTFIDDLVDTMRHANGAGLAANQVARPIRIAAIEVNDNPRYPYKPRIPLTIVVNPTIELIGDETVEINEGCLSVPNLRGNVFRHVTIRVRWLDRHGVALTTAAATALGSEACHAAPIPGACSVTAAAASHGFGK